jgi:hypothetical protein
MKIENKSKGGYKMRANSIEQAWNMANNIIKGDYEKDYNRSQKAGYDIYVSNSGKEWISDLGNRLEVNREDGTSVNIWVEEPKNYAITFYNCENKKVGVDVFTESNSEEVKKAFKECYRHALYKILSVVELPE